MLPASSSTVQRWITTSYQNERKEIERSLHQARSQIHYTLDMWTSPNHLGLLGIVAHFVDRQGQLNRALLALREVEGVHSGENQCRTFVRVLGEYQIHHKTGYIMMDNASNNDTFMEHLEIAQLDSGYCFNAGERRLRHGLLYSKRLITMKESQRLVHTLDTLLRIAFPS